MKLYPLKFDPIYKSKIWGGHKIKNFLHKNIGNLPNCGESWELSGVTGEISSVREGTLKGRRLTDLLDEYKGQLTGDTLFEKYGTRFPLLIKFIDANDDLSVQVHPDDKLAGERHQSPGKTEMWYIIQAENNSTLISGFNRELTREAYLEYLQTGRLMEILNIEKANADDVFFIPAGRVHTIGKGLLLAEIQQTSDVTYRIYDFDRKDSEGRPRELHTGWAVDAIDYQHYPSYRTHYDRMLMNETQLLVHCSYFTTNRLFHSHSFRRNYHPIDSFVILICLDGTGVMKDVAGETQLSKGDVVLIPASIRDITIEVKDTIKLLETYIN